MLSHDLTMLHQCGQEIVVFYLIQFINI